MVGNSSGCKKRSGNQKLDATKDVIVHQTTLMSRSQMDTRQPSSGTKKDQWRHVFSSEYPSSTSRTSSIPRTSLNAALFL